MDVPVLVGWLYKNTINDRIILVTENKGRYIKAMVIRTGEIIEISNYFMAIRYERMGARHD